MLKKYPDIIENPNNYPIIQTIGLLDGIKYLQNQITLDEYIEHSVKITRHYAKRQYTWFRTQFKDFDLSINEIPQKNKQYL